MASSIPARHIVKRGLPYKIPRYIQAAFIDYPRELQFFMSTRK